MQKLKKSLQNNILNLNVKQQSIFSIESPSESDRSADKNKILSSKTLTSFSLKQLDFLKSLVSNKLKFPLKLNVFKDKNTLDAYVNEINKPLNSSHQIVLIKVNNRIFKDKSYLKINSYNHSNVLFAFKQTTTRVITLLKILRILAEKK